MIAKFQSKEGSFRAMIVRHEIWKLRDQVDGDLMSERLLEILDLIDDALPTTPSRTATITKLQMVNSTREFTRRKIPKSQVEDDVMGPSRACLIHCARGKSRSAAVCAAWYLSRVRPNLYEALETIRKVRPQINPNLGFLAWLHAIEQCDGNIRLAIERIHPGGR